MGNHPSRPGSPDSSNSPGACHSDPGLPWQLFGSLELQEEKMRIKAAKLFAQVEEVAAERLNRHRFNFGSLTEADTALPHPLKPPAGCSSYIPPEQLPATETEMHELLAALRLGQTMHLGIFARFSYEGGRFVVVGDLHGNLHDLLQIVDSHGLPNRELQYVFVGDFVDRGINSTETLLLLCALKHYCPLHVVLVRGNHEDISLSRQYGFERQIRWQYDFLGGSKMLKLCGDLFQQLPYCAVLGEHTFVVHGCIPTGVTHLDKLEEAPAAVALNELAALPREWPTLPLDPNERSARLIEEMLWSDPTGAAGGGVKPSPRGRGLHVANGPVLEFLQSNGLQRMVRAHEYTGNGCRIVPLAEGYEAVTVFSASDYMKQSNSAAVVLLEHDGSMSHLEHFLEQPTYEPAAWSCVPNAGSPEASSQYSIPNPPVPASTVEWLRGTLAARRVELLESFQAADQLAHEGVLTGQIGVGVWGECMRRTLPELLLPWEQFETLLGETTRPMQEKDSPQVGITNNTQLASTAQQTQTHEKHKGSSAVVHYDRMLASLGRVFEADAGSALDALYTVAGPLQQVFCLLDTDCDGLLSLEELQAGWRVIWKHVQEKHKYTPMQSISKNIKTQKEMQAVFEAMDTNHDGVVSLNEFLEAYRNVKSLEWVAATRKVEQPPSESEYKLNPGEKPRKSEDRRRRMSRSSSVIVESNVVKHDDSSTSQSCPNPNM